MKKRFVRLLVLGSLLTAGALTAADKEFLDWPEPPGFPPYVLSGSEARLAGPPEFVHSGRTSAIAWSSSGRYLSLLTEEVPPQPTLDAAPPPPVRSELAVWDSTTGKVRRLIREGDSITGIDRSEWLPQSRYLLATITRPVTPGAVRDPAAPSESWLVRIDAGSGKAVALAALSNPGSTAVSKVQPAALAMTVGDRIVLIRPEGPVVDLTDRVRSAAGEGATISRLTTTTDGRLVVSVFVRRDGTPAIFDIRTVEVDAASAAVRLLPAGARPATPPAARTVAEEQLFSLVVTSGKLVSAAGERPVSTVLLVAREESPRSSALLALDATVAELSPAADFAAYVNGEGACYIRRIHKLDRSALVAARREAVQAELMSRGKQFGTAIAMYSQDYDEALPPAGSFNAVAPYLKSYNVSDFIYTSNGGPLSGIEKPAESEAGYIAGPGGKIVVYIDGHVEWVDGP